MRVRVRSTLKRPFTSSTRALCYRLKRAIPRASSRLDLDSVLGNFRPWDVGHELIRVGSRNDGGYLIPNDLVGIEACFSPGVGWTTDFEDDLLQKFGIKSFLADVTAPAECGHERDDVYIGAGDHGRVVSLSSWIASKQVPGGADLILQMDIEGSEWLALGAASDETLRSFRILVIEFHYLERLVENWFREEIALPLFEKLNSQFVLVHAHPNNAVDEVCIGNIRFPRVIEATYMRRDRIRGSVARLASVPHPLDTPNDPRLRNQGLGIITK